MNPDLDWALDTYGQFASSEPDGTEHMIFMTIDGDPWSKQRPRFARRTGRSYQPRDDRAAEKRLRQQMASHQYQYPGNVMLACLFFRSNQNRIDTDNLLKHVSDSATGVWWEDDSQVTLVFGELMLDFDRPRTVIVAGPHYSTLKRGASRLIECDMCGKPFIPTHKGHRFCSAECAHGKRITNLDPRTCPECGSTFAPKNRTQKLCSHKCVGRSLGSRMKSRARALSRCAECGKQLAHHRGGRCRDCWRANPGFYAAPQLADHETPAQLPIEGLD